MSAFPSPSSVQSPPSIPVISTASTAGRRQWNTPRTLKAYRLVVWILAALLLSQGESTLTLSRNAFKTIGKDTVPSIIAAEEIGYALADLDANVANSLLGSAQHRAAASAVIEKQRLKVTDSLVDAAQNITYGDDEKRPIRAMMRDLGLYLEHAAEARLRFEQFDKGGARTSYWQATDLLHKNLLVEAQNLDAANKVQLEVAYRLGTEETEGAEFLACVIGLLLTGTLVALQRTLFRKTRRIFNIPLVAATALAILLPLYLAGRFTNARHSLHTAKEDAFDSIHSLVRARALAYDANGDESRYLLDPTDGRSLALSFRDKIAILSTSATAKPPTPSDLSTRKQATRSGIKPRDTGLLWDELDNITFPGELTAATRMVSSFRDYVTIDARIRKLASAGKMDDAIELCIGDKPDESNAAFDRFDTALLATVDVNRAAFYHEMEDTNRSLGTAETVSIFLTLLISGLTWLGLRPRLLEYTA